LRGFVNADGSLSSILGFPRMGKLRDLKKATESYWGGKLSQDELLNEGKRLRLEHWQIQKNAGIDLIPSNDFSFYDQVLDHIQLFGVGTRSICPIFKYC
jgi:5-methyltetrahydropteroyltriglutamate--homocysteine methyltransferase